LSNQSQVDEVVQDAFLYLMVSLPELDSEIGVLKFMKWKVKNLCLDIYRASGKAYIKSIDDVAEPIALNSELGADLERAEDAAVVRLALSKLNPRHREVLLASIYEEKSTAEIAAQVGLSENATLQLLFRARGAFKKALLGDVDTNGMSMGAILSVAARKAGEDAKKVGVQAMVLVLFLAVSVGAFFNFNSSSNSVQFVADAPVLKDNTSDAITTETGTAENPLKVSTVSTVRERPEVPLAIEEYDPRNGFSGAGILRCVRAPGRRAQGQAQQECDEGTGIHGADAEPAPTPDATPERISAASLAQNRAFSAAAMSLAIWAFRASRCANRRSGRRKFTRSTVRSRSYKSP
jgi:RNA polymerase sigma factor (sigma-70 family)